MAYYFRFNEGGTACIRFDGVSSEHIFYFKLRSPFPDYAGSILYIYDGNQGQGGMSVFRNSQSSILSSDVIDTYLNGTPLEDRDEILGAEAGDVVGIGGLTSPDFGEIYFASRDNLTGRYEGLEIEGFQIDEGGTIHNFDLDGSNFITSDTGTVTLTVLNPEPDDAQWIPTSQPPVEHDAVITIPDPTFSVNAEMIVAPVEHSISSVISAPTFSVAAGVIKPPVEHDISALIPAPTFSAVAVMGEISIIVNQQTNIDLPFLSNNITL